VPTPKIYSLQKKKFKAPKTKNLKYIKKTEFFKRLER
jgi:hypothetical protein